MSNQIQTGTATTTYFEGVQAQIAAENPKSIIEQLMKEEGRDSTDEGALSCGSELSQEQIDRAMLSNMTPKQSRKILYQKEMVDVYLGLEAKGNVKRTTRSVAAVLPSITDEARKQLCFEDDNLAREYGGTEKKSITLVAPHPSTLLKWVRRQERMKGSVLAHVDKRYLSGRSKCAFCLEAQELINECVREYASYKRPPKSVVVNGALKKFRKRNRLKAKEGLRLLRVPSKRTLYREIDKLEPYYVSCQRDGADAANRKFAIIENGVDVLYPMERIEIDEWKVDLITLLAESGVFGAMSVEQINALPKGRRWIYVAMDTATRCILAFRISSNPNSREAISTLEMITKDKTEIARAFGCDCDWGQFGGFGTVVTDQGTAFANYNFKCAVTDLWGTVLFPPAGVPKLRGRVERVFRTFGTKLMPLLSARTMSNVVERGDIDPEKLAAITDDQLAEIFTRFIVDIYHNEPHGGLGGQTPANCWKEKVAQFGCTPPPDRRRRRAAFGQTYERVISGRGVRFCGVFYSNDAIRERYLKSNKRKVLIRVDRSNIGSIEVNLDGGWVEAFTLTKGLDGLSLEAWTLAGQNLRKKYRAEAEVHQHTIDRAIDDIVEIDQRASLRMGLTPQCLTVEQVELNEKQLFLGLDMAAGDPKKKQQAKGLFARRYKAGNGLTTPKEHEDVMPSAAEIDVDFSRASEWRLEAE